MHDVTMNKKIALLVVGIILTSCSSPSSVISTTSPTVEVSSSIETENTETTTIPSIVPRLSKASLPPLTECSIQEISKETKETFKEVLRCVEGWAVGIPQRYVDDFNGETDVEAEWVLADTNTGWKVVGVCHMFYPIYSSGSTCSWPYNSGKIDINLIPPMKVQCVLWAAAEFVENISATGCPSDT